MTTTSSVTSRTQAVLDQLRVDIINGRHEPGKPLRLAELASAFGVSMAVVREALIRLSEQHLVSLTPNQGFRVVEVSRADLIDLTELRVTFETLALRNSILHGDVRWEAEVIAAHHVLERATIRVGQRTGTTEEWSQAHTHFHHCLGSACGSPRLIGIIDGLRDSAELYRQLSSLHAADAERDIVGEHRELMELATARRAEEAATALERHLRQTTEIVLESSTADELA